jgi:DNA-binding NarL/FixJ family response regulator
MSKLRYHTNITNFEISLVVFEDEEQLLKNICEYLTLEGFKVKGFSNSVEGLSYLEKFAVDVVVSDVKMPVVSGFELISKLRNSILNKDVVFIFITAMVEREDQRFGMNLQADDYITKPFAMPDLVNAINTRLKLVAERTSNTASKSINIKNVVFEKLDKLSKAEVKVLYLVALGKTNIQIGERLSISFKTVDNHRYNISDKLSIGGRNNLLKFSIDNKALIKEYISEKMRDIPHFF